MPTLPLTIVPAPPGTLLAREGVMSTVYALALRPGDSPLPITQEECEVCRVNLAEFEWHGAEVGCRVNSDSRYGYAPKHITCHYLAPCFCRLCDKDVTDGTGVCSTCSCHGCTATEPRCKVMFQGEPVDEAPVCTACHMVSGNLAPVPDGCACCWAGEVLCSACLSDALHMGCLGTITVR